jgi:hypothetical protein
MAGWWDKEGLTGKIVRKGMEVTGGVGPGASGPKGGPKKYTRKDLAKIGRDRYLGGKHILTGKELSSASGWEAGSRRGSKYDAYEFKDHTNMDIYKILKQGKLA